MTRPIAVVKSSGRTYRIPEMWLVGRQQSGRTYQEAVQDWIDQEEMEKKSRRRNPELKEVRVVGSNMVEAHHGLVHILYSYKTPVALFAPSGLYKTDQFHSRTTSGHIAKWFRSWNLDPKGARGLSQADVALYAELGKDPASDPTRNPIKRGGRGRFVHIRKVAPGKFVKRSLRTVKTNGRVVVGHLKGETRRTRTGRVKQTVQAVLRKKTGERRVNPVLGVLGNPPGKGTDMGRVSYIEYKHAADGKNYYHHFHPAAHLMVYQNGTAKLWHPQHRLWKLFPKP